MARLKRRKPKWLLGFCFIVGVGSLSLLVSLNTNATPSLPLTLAPKNQAFAGQPLPNAKFKHHHSLWGTTAGTIVHKHR